jgi:hypothetical protein
MRYRSPPADAYPLIELIRYGKRPGQPGRQLIRTGPVTWRCPAREASGEL